MPEIITTQKGLYNTNPDRRKYNVGGKHMPFKSKSQARFMYAKHPKIAKRWAKKTKSIKKLPEKKVNMMGMSEHMMVNCNEQKRKKSMPMGRM